MKRTQTRLALMAALIVAGGAIVYLSAGGVQKNLVYYLDVEELHRRESSLAGQVVRLGGVVQNGSVQLGDGQRPLAFALGLGPEGGETVAVQARGQPPQMFQAGIGAVVEGRYDGRVFVADRVMVKHSNEYRPPAPGEHPKQLYDTLQVNEPSS